MDEPLRPRGPTLNPTHVWLDGKGWMYVHYPAINGWKTVAKCKVEIAIESVQREIETNGEVAFAGNLVELRLEREDA